MRSKNSNLNMSALADWMRYNLRGEAYSDPPKGGSASDTASEREKATGLAQRPVAFSSRRCKLGRVLLGGRDKAGSNPRGIRFEFQGQ